MSPSESRIGYVVKMYPRFSETFIVSELLARQELGEGLEIFSLRPPADGRFHASLAEVRAPVTYLHHARLRAAELWDLLGAANDRLPNLPVAMPELVRAAPDDAAQALDLALRLEAHGVTHLHAHFASVATTVARLASLLTGVPYSFTAHAKDIFHESVDTEDLRRKLRDADHVVTVSEWNRNFLYTRFPAETTRLTVVRNGLRLSDFSFTSPVEREPVVAAVGRLVEKKGWPVLLDALARLHRSGRAVRCVLAGDGPQDAELRAQAARLGLDSCLEMTGPLAQHEIRDLISRATVLAAPCVTGVDGNQDGLPTVLLEAMALGTPVVSTPVTGVPEAVRNGQTGLLVPSNDPVALACAIARLFDDIPMRVRLAAEARTLVENRHDSRIQARQLEALVRAERQAVA